MRRSIYTYKNGPGNDYKKTLPVLFIHVITPLLFGVLIYALFRGSHFFDPNENIFPLLKKEIPEWIKYNLPDGLWLYGFLSSLSIIWRNDSKMALCWQLPVIVFSVCTEILQDKGYLRGTYDIYDVIAYLMAGIIQIYVFYILKYYKMSDYENEKSNFFTGNTTGVHTAVLGQRDH